MLKKKENLKTLTFYSFHIQIFIITWWLTLKVQIGTTEWALTNDVVKVSKVFGPNQSV